MSPDGCINPACTGTFIRPKWGRSGDEVIVGMGGCNEAVRRRGPNELRCRICRQEEVFTWTTALTRAEGPLAGDAGTSALSADGFVSLLGAVGERQELGLLGAVERDGAATRLPFQWVPGLAWRGSVRTPRHACKGLRRRLPRQIGVQLHRLRTHVGERGLWPRRSRPAIPRCLGSTQAAPRTLCEV